ncbi:MAG: preprotein translocase subunit SecG [Pseudoflavonifractor sp.]|nr:preprotein translocase subunit SecG [Pseudoflavonifractor sp.]
MNVDILKLILTILQVLLGVFLVVVVLLQEGKTAGLSGAISGGADTFLSKNKAKSWDAKLARWTKWVVIVFMVLTLVLSLV